MSWITVSTSPVGVVLPVHAPAIFSRRGAKLWHMSLSLFVVLLLVVVAMLAGAVNGVAGFGFALIGTMVAATVLSPATAVVLLIVPIFSVNLSLVGELDGTEIRRCTRRFWPYALAALVGTIIGMVTLDVLPDEPLRLGLGVVTVAFVATRQTIVPVPGLDAARDRCFVESSLPMAGLGAVSGLLFGATNVGVQMVAYFKSCHLSHQVFVGVVAIVFLGINGARIIAAAGLGLYPSLSIALLSAGLAVPSMLGVAAGKRIRPRISEAHTKQVVLGLLTLVGFRLVVAGLGIA